MSGAAAAVAVAATSEVPAAAEVPGTAGVSRLVGAPAPAAPSAPAAVPGAAADSSAGDSNAPAPQTADTAPLRLSPQVVMAPFDPAVGAAFAATGAEPYAPSYLNSTLAIRFQHDSDVARRQDALGSMLWRDLQPRVNPRTQILMPPTNWKLRSDDAGAIMTTLATAIRSGLAVPRPLSAVIAEAP